MKKQFRTLAALFFCGLTLAACSDKEDNEKENVEINATKTYTMTITASKGENSGLSKALALESGSLNATWKQGEIVAVYKSENKIGELTAQSDGASTILSGEFSGENIPVADDALVLKFNDAPNYSNQDGTLEYIAANCDYAVANVTVKEVIDGKITINQEYADFVNQQAIVKFTLKNGDDALTATSLNVKIGETSYNFTSTSSEYFLATPSVTSATVKLTAHIGEFDYTKENTVTFDNGSFYNINVKNMSVVKVAGSLAIQETETSFILNPTTTSQTFHVTYMGGTLAVSNLSNAVTVAITNGGATDGNTSKTATVTVTRTNAKFNGNVTFSVTPDDNHNAPESIDREFVGGVELASSAVGDRVCTDSYAYPAASRTGTVAGMVAYKSGDNGTVIASSDGFGTTQYSNWNTAKENANNRTPKVTGQTWILATGAGSYDTHWTIMWSNSGGCGSWENLQNYLSSAGCTPLSTNCTYWTGCYANGGTPFTYEGQWYDANSAIDMFRNGGWEVASINAAAGYIRYIFEF